MYDIARKDWSRGRVISLVYDAAISDWCTNVRSKFPYSSCNFVGATRSARIHWKATKSVADPEAAGDKNKLAEEEKHGEHKKRAEPTEHPTVQCNYARRTNWCCGEHCLPSFVGPEGKILFATRC